MDSKRMLLLLSGLVILVVFIAAAWFLFNNQTVHFVSPNGSDVNEGTDEQAAFATIQKAVEEAEPGDKITILPGDYYQDIQSVRSGLEGKPITISGEEEAVIYGAGSSRVININHSFITLDNITVDGLYGAEDQVEGYRDKLVYVEGIKPNQALRGVRIVDSRLQNAGDECIHLRYRIIEAEIAGNTITDCGIRDFRFDGDGKNGEAVYIGTARDQLSENPTQDTDTSSNNWIHHNTIHTNGNECVDIKEGAHDNLVEFNTCSGQQDPDSGGFVAYGNDNVFRYNHSFGNVGAGIRVGENDIDDSQYDDGINNSVYYNRLENNEYGAIKVETNPQAVICGNIDQNNGSNDGMFGQEYESGSQCPEGIEAPESYGA